MTAYAAMRTAVLHHGTGRFIRRSADPRELLTFASREDARVWIADRSDLLPADAPARDAVPSVVAQYEDKLMDTYRRSVMHTTQSM